MSSSLVMLRRVMMRSATGLSGSIAVQFSCWSQYSNRESGHCLLTKDLLAKCSEVIKVVRHHILAVVALLRVWCFVHLVCVLFVSTIAESPKKWNKSYGHPRSRRKPREALVTNTRL